MGRRNRWRHAARACTALRPIPIVLMASTSPSYVLADPAQADMANMVFADPQGVMGISVAVALGVFATVATLLHLAGRKAWGEREAELTAELSDVRAKLDRAQVFLAAETQIVIAWGSPDAEPEIEGDVALLADAPIARRVLGFGSWLTPQAAQQLEGMVERLRLRGEAFRMPLQSVSGRHLEAEGRAVSGRAVMRIRDVSGDRLELTRLRDRHAAVAMQLESFHAMLDAAPGPAWLRDHEGRLVWINTAYLRATEAQGREDALVKQTELLDLSARDEALRARQGDQVWCARVPAVVAGQRHMLEVVDLPAPGGSVGFATDVSELEEMRADLGRQMDAHARTLDQLSTAVAIFDRHRKLVFHNAAYRQLWSLDAAFLHQFPFDGEILDRLRAEGRLPEQADFRSWKAGLMAAYQSVETSEHVWYLPDGRTLRTVVNPNPQGGVTYLFDDVTERFHLESRYNALIRVQGETLDSLKEGVAVFGTDGRLKLYNPAFAS
ncbi:MAG: two-component sensor histidine kinase, partial [Hyphomicrobiales bacterium]|nr:two-component sensor histidine kinase [Hyphomicrobiales bacterium]